MTPLDDELRRTLSSRASVVTPSADPMAGIETRVSRIRRRRTAVAVAGAAAAVAVVALVVPGVIPDRGPTRPDSVGTTPTSSPSSTPSPVVAAEPTNVLTWETRGQQSVTPPVADLKARFAEAMGRGTASDVAYHALFVGDTDSGVHYTMGQAWFEGDAKAYSVSYATGGTNGPELFLGPATPAQPWGLAFLVGSLPGTSVDLLVVVPRPGIGQLSYAEHATGAFRPVASGRSDLNGVALIDRTKDATDDRFESLDGDGDLDHPLYRGPVTALLCGLRECG